MGFATGGIKSTIIKEFLASWQEKNILEIMNDIFKKYQKNAFESAMVKV